MATSAGSTGATNAGAGITGGYTGDSLALRIVIGSFIAIAWYNAIELLVLILVTFRKYSGLYFWSLTVSSWGVVFYGIGFLFKFFQIISNDYVNVVFITIGWWAMVTGQSVVLFSRLHLICLNEKLLRRILWMIIIDAIVLHIPTTALTFGSNADTNTQNFVHGYNVMEKIQMTGFCLQEFIISGIYLWECVKFLRTGDQGKSRKTLYGLFYINMIIVIMDITLLGLEFANLYILEIVTKGMVYSVKLKLEFAILGKLVQYVKPHSGQLPYGRALDVYDFLGTSQPTTGLSTDLAMPRVARKRQCSCHTNGAPDVTIQHVETRSGHVPMFTQFEPIHVNKVHRGEDEIEEMMRKYSVGE